MQSANDIINEMGGTGATAEACGVTKQAVSQWRKSGIPVPWRRYLECAYPAVFGGGEGESCAKKTPTE